MGKDYNTNGEEMTAYRILVGKPEGKRPPGRPRRSCVDNIKINLGEIGWNGVDWIDLAQDRDQCRAAQFAASQEGPSSISECVMSHSTELSVRSKDSDYSDAVSYPLCI
jgi:hypothetical protein